MTPPPEPASKAAVTGKHLQFLTALNVAIATGASAVLLADAPARVVTSASMWTLFASLIASALGTVGILAHVSEGESSDGYLFSSALAVVLCTLSSLGAMSAAMLLCVVG